MSLGLIGKKCGMTRIFTDNGAVPVTVLSINANRVVQVKTIDRDGYSAVQIAAGNKKSSKVNKAMAGHYTSANVTAGNILHEFRLDSAETESYTVGSEIKLNVFNEGQVIDVCATSIGKGFQGGVKRHHFSMLDATHGNSISHRSNGSIGMCQTPGRVFKGKKMSGQMGAVKRTVQNLTVHSIDNERSLILVTGSVPGAKGGDVIITPAIKMKNKG